MKTFVIIKHGFPIHVILAFVFYMTRLLAACQLKYRTRAEIIAQMLEATKSDLVGITKSRIMYCASLSFTQSREYLKLVLDRELLNYDADNKRYRLTHKGVEYLEMFHKTKSLLDV